MLTGVLKLIKHERTGEEKEEKITQFRRVNFGNHSERFSLELSKGERTTQLEFVKLRHSALWYRREERREQKSFSGKTGL